MREYKDFTIELSGNRKTKYIVDVTKGCVGAKIIDGGCYHSCFSLKMARMAGVDFTHTVTGTLNEELLKRQLSKIKDQSYIRVGIAGDPSEAWPLTVRVSQLIREAGIAPVVTTKAWKVPTARQMKDMAAAEVFLHVSCSGLDSHNQTVRRLSVLDSFNLLKKEGAHAVMRIVSAPFLWGTKEYNAQEYIVGFANSRSIPILETPLRMFKNVPFFSAVDETKLTHHVSIFTGKPDSQFTAGFILTTNPQNMCHKCEECANECQPKS